VEYAGSEVLRVKLGGAGGNPPLLKALPTIDWPALRRLKRNGGFFATLGAGGGGFHAMVALAVSGLSPLGLAIPATLRFVLESLVGVEELLSGTENKLRAAVRTLQDPVPVLHRCTPPLEQGPTHSELRNGPTPRGLCRAHFLAVPNP